MGDKDLLYAYMAGFVDADGSISIISVGRAKTFIVRITVNNTNYDIIELFSKEFGGKIRKNGNTKRNIRWKECYEWTLTNNKGLNVIKKLYPYLIIKKQQADLTIELQQLRSDTKKQGISSRWHKEEWNKKIVIMNDIKQKCLLLNKRGK